MILTALPTLVLGATVAGFSAFIAFDERRLRKENAARLRERRDLARPSYRVVCDPATEAGASRTPAASPQIDGRFRSPPAYPSREDSRSTRLDQAFC